MRTPWFRLLAIVAIAATGTIACQSPKPGTLVDWFMAASNDPNFQAEGSISGTITVQTTPKLKAKISGHLRIKGGDNATSMSMELAGITNTMESVLVGSWDYERNNGGAWTRTPRKITNVLSEAVEKAGGLTDKGVETHNGRELHRLEPKDLSSLKAEDLVPSTPGSTSTAYTDVTFAFWSEQNGTPAGYSFSAGWDQKMPTGTTKASMSIDYNFDSLSTAVIEVPEEAREPQTAAYSAASRLKADVAGLKSFSGSIEGSYTAGSVTLKLKGYIEAANGGVIDMTAGPYDELKWGEIVAGGVRYVTHDAKIWVNRGKKTTPTLLSVLSAADTSQDAGVETYHGRQLHRIVSPIGSLDVASALGLDFPGLSGPTGRLWLWADDEGKLIGFGASVQWGAMVDNAPKSYSLTLDSLLVRNPSVTWFAPKNPWKWLEDKPRGVAFAVPGNFVKTYSGANEMVYEYKKSGLMLDYLFGGSGGSDADDLIDRISGDWHLNRANRYEYKVGEQTAQVFLGSKNKLFVIGYVLTRGGAAYAFLVAGPDTQRKSVELLGDQIISTIRFDS